jgi:hypothetical protein
MHSEEARKIITAAEIISVPWNVHKGNLKIVYIYSDSNITDQLVIKTTDCYPRGSGLELIFSIEV